MRACAPDRVLIAFQYWRRGNANDLHLSLAQRISADFYECSLMEVSRISCLNTRFHAGRKLNFLEERKRTSLTSALLPLRRNPPNLLDEWIGDLPLIAEVVASQLAKITCPTGGNTSRTGFNGNPHPPAPDARASAVTARAPAQVALAL